MGILKRLSSAIGKAAGRVRAFFSPKPKPPAPAMSQGQKREKIRAEKEAEANQRAIWAIQNAMMHPEDKTAQEGRRKAIEYLSRAEGLKKRGKLQDWNRQQMAERWIGSELASETGQQARKDRKLDIFNQNFNMDLNQQQADLVADLMDTDTYQQLSETYAGIYGEIIQAMGEAIESGTDPLRVEQTLDTFLQYDIKPEFDSFRQVLDLSTEDFALLQSDLYEKSESVFYRNDDEIGRQQQMESVLGNYIEWK